MLHRSHLRSLLQLARTALQAVVSPVGSNGAARSAEGSDVIAHSLLAKGGQWGSRFLFFTAFYGVLFSLGGGLRLE